MLGSLASLMIHHGDTGEARSLLRSARRELGEQPAATADDWVAALEGTARAGEGDEAGAWSSIERAHAAAERATAEDTPWPWVFPFDARKVASQQLACAVLLHRPDVARESVSTVEPLLSSGHVKQRALLMLDVASSLVQGREFDQAFGLARRAVEIAVDVRSVRVVERARRFRGGFSHPCPPKFVEDFDSRLRTASLW
jgi:hypothetical protein